MTSPAPHAGVALISALNILEGYNITSQMPRSSIYHWIAEVVFQLFHHYTAQTAYHVYRFMEYLCHFCIILLVCEDSFGPG